ncbi:FAR-17a/AIG1-like protein [Armillaria novae-zelandiae]|uniref:FAR-17a/AIG1-like protein n=1 Tax=Armillaria novae-zelandiae TaxID=153914 RepID=A0AA39PI17_9AGAR|nr:FAR-17a/AIG1-like protein [Armillaria novae-zelandiae]
MAFSLSPVLLHSAATAIMAWAHSQLGNSPIDPIVETQYGGHYQFLTILGLVASLCTMGVALLVDLFPSIPALRSLKRAMLMVCMPVEAVIVSVYWTLLLLFPSLILQKYVPSELTSSQDALPLARIPLPLDLAMHVVPGLSLVLDFLVFEKKYSQELVKLAVPVVLTCGGMYSSWAERNAKLNDGIFPYPFLTENPFETRLSIYIGACVIGYVYFRVLNALHA